MYILSTAICSNIRTEYRLSSVPISVYRIPCHQVEYLYIVSRANRTLLCISNWLHISKPRISYRQPSFPISVYCVVCHQFPSKYFVSPDICSHLCISYRLTSVRIYYIVSHAIKSHLLSIVSPAISSHLCLSYRMSKFPIFVNRIQCHLSHLSITYQLPSVTNPLYRFACTVPNSVYRMACHKYPSLLSYEPSIPNSVYLIACNHFPSQYIYRLPPVHILVHRIACVQSPLIHCVSPTISSISYIVLPAISSHLCV